VASENRGNPPRLTNRREVSAAFGQPAPGLFVVRGLSLFQLGRKSSGNMSNGRFAQVIGAERERQNMLTQALTHYTLAWFLDPTDSDPR
jgi:hypothetical protein